MVGCCSSQVCPNAPPHPDVALNVCAVPLSRYTLYSLWSFFLSPKRYIAEANEVTLVNACGIREEREQTMKIERERAKIGVGVCCRASAKVSRGVTVPLAGVRDRGICLFEGGIGYGSATGKAISHRADALMSLTQQDPSEPSYGGNRIKKRFRHCPHPERRGS